jgi:hypothetical protein
MPKRRRGCSASSHASFRRLKAEVATLKAENAALRLPHLLREPIFLWEEQDQKRAKPMIDHLLTIKTAVDTAFVYILPSIKNPFVRRLRMPWPFLYGSPFRR